MTEQRKTPEQVACEICLTEVPLGDAHKAETDDYIVYFCGLECYRQWQKQHRQDDGSNQH